MRQHEVNAMAVARFLEKNPRVEKVVYPGEACILYKAVLNDKMVFFFFAITACNFHPQHIYFLSNSWLTDKAQGALTSNEYHE